MDGTFHGRLSHACNGRISDPDRCQAHGRLAPWKNGAPWWNSAAAFETCERLSAMKIGFLYNHDASHQVPHTIPIAAALAKRGIDIEVLTSSEAQRAIAHA